LGTPIEVSRSGRQGSKYPADRQGKKGGRQGFRHGEISSLPAFL
jgi:hypothetical protein